MKRILYFILTLFVLPTLHAQEVKVATSTKNIKIGEQIEYKISVQAPADAVVIFPEGQTFGALEMVKTNPTDTLKEKGKFRLEKAYYLTQFDEGKYTIPQQKIQISHKDFYTDSLLVEVHNVAVDTLKQPLYDAKPIVEVTSPSSSHLWLWIVLGIVALLLTAAALYFFVFRKKKLSAEEERKKLPPFERAIQDLKDLQNSKYLIESQHKAYYTRLTDIVKEYLEDEVHILAKESTTDELLAKINNLQKTGKLYLSTETINNLKRVLQNADLVKFAKSKPSDNNAEYDRETIENVVIKTKEAIPIVETEAETNQIAEEAKVTRPNRKLSRWQKRLIIGLCSLVLFLIFIFGYNKIRLKYFSIYAQYNKVEWVTSDYGYPITELTTPEVLIRKQIVDIVEYKSIIDKQYTFYYGSLNSPLYIMTNIITFKKDAQNTASQQEGQDGGLTLDPKKVNEIVLSQLDKAKAKNITTLTEEYTSPNGAKGMKVFGKMSIPNEKGKYFNASYELYSFTENNALQQVLITYINEPNANKIAQRVINSIVFKTE
ncbi:hypothetical protein I7X30_06340 [Capnocytophaga sp. 051621]|uniref:Protein BatD n=2 Tax=Capnocytophaga TaxID=1016 RepID=A0ABS1YU10_9FLAO|nr:MULTISPECIES: hypothetical protein [Capnocytophaga]MBI1646676.1 hypothetical protein [Capnocytophaga periodontitidis]MBM0649898.1 hypothetical protein [Capnocytophaga genosp. AHN8471]MBM0662370.1 hypothetical protein [Capnocytophaga genosp. AHN8471]